MSELTTLQAPAYLEGRTPSYPPVNGGKGQRAVETTDGAMLPYDLPDAALLEKTDGVRGRMALFVPAETLVVIGRGSNPELEIHADLLEAESVPVLRRATGGCAVVLTPEMVAVSFALYTQEQLRSSEYFRRFNGVIIHALESLGVTGLAHEGISDIALHGRKVAGTAIYRNRDLIFYHAILNLGGTTELMERYLKRPPRMPEYRAGRSHAEFVTSLAAAGFMVDVDLLRDRLDAEFQALLMDLAPVKETAS